MVSLKTLSNLLRLLVYSKVTDLLGAFIKPYLGLTQQCSGLTPDRAQEHGVRDLT